MTYFLEKHFEINEHGDVVPMQYYFALIRPCEWDYYKAKDFILGKSKKKAIMYKAELRERPEEQGNDCPACGADYNSAVALFLLTKRRTSDMMIYAEPSTWWLRTPGREKECRMVVGYDGRPSTDGRVIDSIEVKIRPAMWLDLGRLAIFSADGGIKTE